MQKIAGVFGDAQKTRYGRDIFSKGVSENLKQPKKRTDKIEKGAWMISCGLMESSISGFLAPISGFPPR